MNQSDWCYCITKSTLVLTAANVKVTTEYPIKYTYVNTPASLRQHSINNALFHSVFRINFPACAKGWGPGFQLPSAQRCITSCWLMSIEYPGYQSLKIIMKGELGGRKANFLGFLYCWFWYPRVVDELHMPRPATSLTKTVMPKRKPIDIRTLCISFTAVQDMIIILLENLHDFISN